MILKVTPLLEGVVTPVLLGLTLLAWYFCSTRKLLKDDSSPALVATTSGISRKYGLGGGTEA